MLMNATLVCSLIFLLLYSICCDYATIYVIILQAVVIRAVQLCFCVQYCRSNLLLIFLVYTQEWTWELGCSEYVRSTLLDNAKWFSTGDFINLYSDITDGGCIRTSNELYPCQHFVLSDFLMSTNLVNKIMSMITSE